MIRTSRSPQAPTRCWTRGSFPSVGGTRSSSCTSRSGASSSSTASTATCAPLSARAVTPYYDDVYRARQEGRLAEFYETLTIDDAQLERGLQEGSLVLDTRLRDALRTLRSGGSERRVCLAGVRGRPALVPATERRRRRRLCPRRRRPRARPTSFASSGASMRSSRACRRSRAARAPGSTAC